MSWAPQEDGLREVLNVLRESTQNESQAVQKAMTLRLQEFNAIPDYACYLGHILSSMPQENERLRAVAGLVLKNHTVTHLSRWVPQVLQHVKHQVLIAFNDPAVMVRNAAGQVIVAILEVVEPVGWPEVLQNLLTLLDSSSIDQQTAAFGVLEKACEDYPKKFNVEIAGVQPLDFMIPKFISLTEHPNAKMRAHALTSLSHFIPLNTNALNTHIDTFIGALFKRAADENPDVRQTVCQCLVMLLAARPDKIVPNMNDVASFMLYSTQDKDENVALEACEFWLTFAEEPDLQDHLRPILDRLAPVLLQCMVYSEEDLMWLIGDEEDANVPDRPEDIKPRHYGGATHSLEHDATAGSSNESGQALRYDQEEEEEDDEEDYDYDEDDMATDWNLRKCAAAAIDVLAVRFGGDLMNLIMPHLKEKLRSTDWLQRESGILALGAMAEGCMEALQPYLPSLVPFLISSLNDPKALVRSIVCWTLGRYAAWCTQNRTDEHRNTYFIPAMEGLLRMVLDTNKRVQEAGCSAFATFEEDAGRALEPFLEPILRNLVFAFQRYQQKNLLILYDAVGTLADSVGDALGTPLYVNILMPPLIEKWQKLADDDEALIPLLECLSSVTMACGRGFVDYAEPVFTRSLRIVHDQIVKYSTWTQAVAANPNADVDEPDKTFLIVALDLLSGLVQGLGSQVTVLIENCQPNLLPLVGASLKHPEPAVRQSAYALIGDLAISVPGVLRPAMTELMPELISQLTPEPRHDFISASNNAAWSVGEIALHIGEDPEFQRWIPSLIEHLLPVLLNAKKTTPKSLVENAAVTIGRLALVQPAVIAPQLDTFAQQWCQALWEIKDNPEKDSAFRGFCSLIELNPGGLQNHFIYFCNSAAKWNNPSPELDNKFRGIFNGFKTMLGPQWDATLSQIPQPITERLKRYGV